ncbi:MAG: cell wall-binding repeat-containing protein, partial [Acidimicrobiaceae bacterium]|nr:cell wall-binding repeat-containing protein [Acidimicrobiaceae bacterium]
MPQWSLCHQAGLQSTAARPDLVEFLRSAGVRRVVIVGDAETLPNHEPSVLFGLGMLPRNIERVHGTDPIEAAIAVAERIGAPAEFSERGRTVIIASDRSVADAVAVGPLAAAGPFPLLLTAQDSLEPRIAAYLADHEIAHVVLVGGAVAVSAAVQDAIETADITVTRLAGRDRSDTARLAADLFDQHTGDNPECADGPTRIGFAPAERPERALTAGPLLAQRCAPLRYTESDRLPADLQNSLYLAQHGPASAQIVAFADDRTIPDSLLRPSVPPVRIAAWQLVNERLSGEIEVVLVVFDEQGNKVSLPSTRMAIRDHHTAMFDPRFPEGFYWIDWGERLTWAPDGRRIAYVHATVEDLRVLDVTTGEETRLRYVDAIPRPASFRGIDWSHDSTQLLLSATIDDESTVSEDWTETVGRREYSPELFLYRESTGSLSRLTHNDFSEFSLHWSPDGSRFAYYSTLAPGGAGLPYSRLVSLYTYDVASGASYKIASNFGTLDGLHAHWSSDGTRIAFGGATRNRPAAWFQSELFIADYDGSNLLQLTPSNCPSCFADRISQLEGIFEPFVTFPVSWSPSSERIVYYSDGSLQIHDLGTGKVRVLIPRGPSRVGVPEALSSKVVGWTSDSETLYVQPRGADCQVVAFDIDGENTDALALIIHESVGWCGVDPRKSPSDLRRCMRSKYASASSGGHLRGESYQC